MAVSLDDLLGGKPLVYNAAQSLGPDGPAVILGLHAAANMYCWLHMTDGFVPAAWVHASTLCKKPRAVADYLVAQGVWTRTEDARGLGYVIPDFLQWNKSAERRRAEQAANRDRQRRHKQQQSGGVTNAEDNALFEALLTTGITRDDGVSSGVTHARAIALIRSPDPGTEEHRPAAGSLAVDGCGKPRNVLQLRPLRMKAVAPRQLKALVWREVELHYALAPTDLCEHLKGIAAKAGIDYSFTGGNWRSWAEIAQVRCHIRELVQAGLRGFVLVEGVEQRLRSQHLIAVLDPDSLTRAIESELKRVVKRRRTA